MSQLGLGVMINMLTGNHGKDAQDYYGLKIKNAFIDEDQLTLIFSDDCGIKLWDNGQSCCESRYITCDDDVKDLIGGKLRLIEEKEHKEENSEYGEPHEQVFIEVATDSDSIVMCTHNEHNGYYGGF